MTEDEIKKQKDIEFYAASVAAWYGTSLEHDKSLFALSAGGIGLLITLLTTVGLSSAEALVLYICALGSFLVCIISILIIFKGNQTYIQQIVSDGNSTNDPKLAIFDSIAFFAFGIGALFTAIIGVSAAINSYATKEKSMTKDNTNKEQQVQLKESYNGASKLQVTTDLNKSFNGAGSLQQSSTNNSSASQAVSTTSSSASQVASKTTNQTVSTQNEAKK